MVYSRNIDGKMLTFGISGRLYRSNVLLYDHQSESLWSQLMSNAIAGPMVGRELTPLPSVRVTWRQWRQMHTKTLVLSTETGYARNYALDPYEGYYRVGSLMFPVGKVRRDFSPKQRVLGVAIDGRAKAYALEDLVRGGQALTDRIGGADIVIEVTPEGEVAAVRRSSGEPVTHLFAYWFAWQAFYPGTQVYR